MFVFGLLRLAYSNLLVRKLSSALTMVGLLFGSAAFIATLCTTEGSKRQIKAQMQAMGTDLIWINSYGQDVHLGTQEEEVLKKYISGIKAISFKEQGNGRFRNEANEYSGGLYGVDPNYFDVSRLRLAHGRYFNQDDFSNLRLYTVLGSEASNKLFEKQNPLGKQLIVEQDEKLYVTLVIGVLQAKGADEDKAVLMPRSTYVKIASASGGGSQNFLVKTINDDITSSIRKSIELILQPKFKDNIFVYDAATQVKASQEIMGNITLAGLSLAIISLITGGIGIMNVMLLSIAQRKKEIGLRKALGASSWMVMTQFLLEAVLICLSGTVIGAAVGIAAGQILANIMKVEAAVSWFVVGVSFAFSICIGLIFGLLPALKASRLDPYEALRG